MITVSRSKRSSDYLILISACRPNRCVFCISLVRVRVNLCGELVILAKEVGAK
jgi:hypothetical protein